MIPSQRVKLCFRLFTSLRQVCRMYKVARPSLTSCDVYKQTRYFHAASCYYKSEKIQTVGKGEKSGIQDISKFVDTQLREFDHTDVSTWTTETFYQSIYDVKDIEGVLNILKTNIKKLREIRERYKLLRFRKVLEICTIKLQEFCENDDQQTQQIVRSEPFTQLLAYIDETVGDENVADIMFSKHLMGNVLMICGKLKTSDELERFKVTLDKFISKYSRAFYTEAYVGLIVAIQKLDEYRQFHVICDECERILNDHIADIQSPEYLLENMQKIIPNFPVNKKTYILHHLLSKSCELIPEMDWTLIQNFILMFHPAKFYGYQFDPKCIKTIHAFIKDQGQLYHCSVDPEKLLMACSNMGIYLPEFLQLISNSLYSHNIKHPMMVLKEMKSLRLRDTDLLDVLLSKKPDTLRSTAHMTVSIATLNYSSHALRKTLQEELPKADLASLQPPVLAVSFVWSLCVLDMWHADVFKQILSQEFQSDLLASIEDSTLFVRRGVQKKMKMIQEFDYYRGDGKQTDLPILKNLVTRKKMNSVTASLLESVFSRSAQMKYLQLNHHTAREMPIDCEMIVDEDSMLYPYSEKSDKHHRIVLQGLKYFEMTIPTSEPEPLGMAVLYKRLLELEGYKVVTIPYYELYGKNSPSELQEYLHNKVKEVIGATEKSCPSWRYLLP